MMLSRVLLVSDDRYTLRLLSRLLGDSYELCFAHEGREALACLQSQGFDVVLMQVRGPEGLEILRAAKGASPDSEVIVMTRDDAHDRAVEAAYALGAYECLTPFESETVVRAVERAAERHALRSEVASLRRELDGQPSRAFPPSAAVR